MLNNYLMADFYALAWFFLSPSNVPACNGVLQSFTSLCNSFWCCQVLHDSCLVHPVKIYHGMHYGDSMWWLWCQIVVLYAALVVDWNTFHVKLVISDWHLHSIFKWYGVVHQSTHAFTPDQLHSLATTDNIIYIVVGTINVMVDTA